MRLNALSPSENPMEQLLYCFGGPDNGGDDGGSTHPGRPGGESGERGNRTDRGDGNDRDDRGGGSDDNQQDRQAYSDRFGGVSTRNFNVDTNQGFVDTDKGRVYGSSDVLGKGIAEGDITPSESQQAALDAAANIATDMGIDPSNIAVGGDLFFGEEDVIANQDLSFGGGSFTPTAVTQAARGPALANDNRAFALPNYAPLTESDIVREGYRSSSAPGAIAEAQARNALSGITDTRTGLQTGTVARDTVMSPSDFDIFGDGIMTDEERAASNAELAAIDARATAARNALAAGTPAAAQIQEARSSALGPVVGLADQQLTGASGAVTDILSGYDQALAPFASDFGPIGPDQIRADEINLERQQYEDYINTGQVGRELAPNEVVSFTDFEGKELSSFKPAQTAEERANQIANFALNKDPRIASAAQLALANTVGTAGTPAAAQVEAARSSALGGPTPGSMPGQAADIEVTYGPEDLAKAQADLAAARRAAYADKQFGFDTGLPESIDVYGVDFPTSVGLVEGIADAVFNPTASTANIIAERGIKSVDGMSAEGTANYNPQGVEVVTAGGPLSEGGRTAVYDPSNNIVYDTNPFSGLNPFGEGVPDNIQALYDRKNAIDNAERERNGDNDGSARYGSTQPVIPPTAPTAPPEPDPFELREYNYQPRGPISYSYTGLPSLAPTRLQPSFRARGSYSPLFPIG